MLFLNHDHAWVKQSFGLSESGLVKFLLLQLGIPQKLDGFLYLEKSILLYREDKSRRFTKEIYPFAAGLTDSATSAAMVDQAIRRAIVAGMVLGDQDIWMSIFHPGKNNVRSRPGNVTFIKSISVCIDLIQEYRNMDISIQGLNDNAV